MCCAVVAELGKQRSEPRCVANRAMESDDDWISDLVGGRPDDQAALAVCQPLGAVVAVQPPAPRAACPRPRGLAMPHPRKRSRAEEHFAASRMREAKARKLKNDLRARQAAEITLALDNMNGGRVGRGVLIAKQKVSRGLVFVHKKRAGEKTRRSLTFPQMLSIAFEKVRGLGNVSKMYSLDERWIAKTRNAVAFSFLRCVFLVMEAASAVMQVHPPTVFVSSMAFDESTEALLLPLVASAPAATQRSSWHALLGPAELGSSISVVMRISEFENWLRSNEVPVKSWPNPSEF